MSASCRSGPRPSRWRLGSDSLHSWCKQLTATGLTRPAITKRVARGLLHRRYRGVYAIGHAALSREGEWLAAVLDCGPGTVLSHLSAAELHGVDMKLASLIAVVSPRSRTLAGVRVHTTRGLDRRDVTTERGIPVTTIHRLFVDLSGDLTAHELVALMREAKFRGRFVEPSIRDAMERANGRHHLGVLDRALALFSAGTRSGNEVLFSGRPSRAARRHPTARLRSRLPLAGGQVRRRDRRPTA